MTHNTHDAYNPVVAHIMGCDVTHAGLERAFNKVADKKNWKYPVNTTVKIGTPFEKAMIAEAVTYFTGSVAKFTALKNDTYWVRAAGYYKAIGA